MDLDAHSKLEMYISCKNLPNLDTFSKSDPFVVVQLLDEKNQKYNEIGRTETIQDNLDPVFQKQFIVDYFFEENQTLRFLAFDSDSKSENLKKHDFIGSVTVTISDLVVAPGQIKESQLLSRKKKPIGKKDKFATMIIKVEEISATKDQVRLNLRGMNLDKKDFFGKSDPYLEFWRLREDGSYVKVHTTEIIKYTYNPKFKQMTLSMQQLCNGDIDRPLEIRCFDWDRNDDPDVIGFLQCSVRDLTTPNFKREFINKEIQKKKGKKYKNSGYLICDSCQIISNPTFLDYIRGGCQVSLMVAIDYTGSNGPPSQPGTLHFRDKFGNNQYQQAIKTVGGIVAPYDTDKKFPVWGFGGRINNEVSHCFALTMDENNPEVQGVQGILDVYDYAFKYVKLSGPTLFTQIIQTAASIASEPFVQDKQHYSILLILTDGVINDMDSTINSIYHGCSLPLSIIIVGVGDADFSQMERLDGDGEEGLVSQGRKVPRDIVQFVPFNKFKDKNINELAKETLKEVPTQFLQYMKMKKVKPNKPRENKELGNGLDRPKPKKFKQEGAEEEKKENDELPPDYADLF